MSQFKKHQANDLLDASKIRLDTPSVRFDREHDIIVVFTDEVDEVIIFNSRPSYGELSQLWPCF